MLKLAVAFCVGELESVALTVKENVPAVVGVPLICPELMSVSPAGKEPELSDQMYGAVPPLAASDPEYAVLAIPEGKELTVIVRAVGFTWPVELPPTTPAHPDNPMIADTKAHINNKAALACPFGEVPQNIISPSTSLSRG
jgi:hypothetical protein